MKTADQQPFIGSVASVASTIVPVAFLLGAALWNGYPLVYSDTSAYLASGFLLETPIDRPITYGLFLRVCSFNGASLWWVVVAQAMLLAYAMGLALRGVGVERPWVRSAIIAAVGITTGASFIAGQLITDVFTPILFLVLFVLLSGQALTRTQRGTTYALFLLSYAMHMSHIAVLALVLIAFVARRLWFHRRALRSLAWRPLFTMLALAVVGTVAMGPSLAKSKNSYFAARMAESGVLQRYLQKYCATEHLRLCDRAGAIPRSADAFLWAEDSPQKLYADRKEMQEEFGRIGQGSFMDRELLGLHARGTVSNISRQLIHFDVGDGNGAFGAGELMDERISRFVPGDLASFNGAVQMQKDQFRSSIITFNRVYTLCMIAGLVIVFALSFTRMKWKFGTGVMHVVLFLLGSYALNAAINSSLVMVADRFGTKMAWAIPFGAILLIATINKERHHQPSINT